MDHQATTESQPLTPRLSEIDASGNKNADVFQWQANCLHSHDIQTPGSDPPSSHENNSGPAADDCQSLCGSSSATESTEAHTPIIPGSEADFEEFQCEHGLDVETSSAGGEFKVKPACLVRHFRDDSDRPGAELKPLYSEDSACELSAKPCRENGNDLACSSSRAAEARRGLDRETKSEDRAISLQTQTCFSGTENMPECIFGLLLGYYSGSDPPSTQSLTKARDMVNVSAYIVQLGVQGGAASAAPSDPTSTSAESGMLSPSASSHGLKRGLEPESRKNSGYGDDETAGGGDDDDDEEKGAMDSNRSKKSKPESSLKLSCPYRKRNPLRFNIRDSPQCSLQSYSVIANLKRHIKIFHRRNQHAYVCPRCKDSMPTKEALDQHQMLPASEMCEPRLVAPESLSEDGITPQVETILNDRKNTGKVDSWSTLWCVLFPEDKDGGRNIPLPEFIPPVEIEELEHEIRENISKLEETHREALAPLFCNPGISEEIKEELVQASIRGSRVFIDYITQHCREKYAAPEPGTKRPRNSRAISELSFQHPSSLRSPVLRHSAQEYAGGLTPRSTTASSTGDSVSTASGPALSPISHISPSNRAEAPIEAASGKPARKILPSAPGMKPQVVELPPVVISTSYDRRPSQSEHNAPTPIFNTKVAGFVSTDSPGPSAVFENKLHSLASVAAVVSGTNDMAIHRDNVPSQTAPDEATPEFDPS